MRIIVVGAKRRVKAVKELLRSRITDDRSSYDVSDVKRDGTLFVRFHSTNSAPARITAAAFEAVLIEMKVEFSRENGEPKYRMRADQFGNDEGVLSDDPCEPDDQANHR